jgi:sulfatase maturation enzyme AslB (radical SAM superfamily)
LTRRCNLKCEYCAIVKNYEHKPAEYPDMKYYHDNEMSTDFVLDTLMKLKEHNPNIFNLFYGGEPLLRQDLAVIINFCNAQDIHYTIISNNCDEIDPLFQKLMIDVTDGIKGYTASIDPILISCDDNIIETDRFKKSQHGYRKLIELSKNNKIKDLVAEMTVCKDDVQYISETVYELKSYDIATDITFVDIAKNMYYDFSNIREGSSLVKPSLKLARELIDVIDDVIVWDQNIHMPELYEGVFEILPSNLDCGLDSNVHNITIDADGSMRLCLRIKGLATPRLKANKVIQNGIISPILEEFIKEDLIQLCRGCNWTCVLMSKMLEEGDSNVNSLVHLDKRGG